MLRYLAAKREFRLFRAFPFVLISFCFVSLAALTACGENESDKKDSGFADVVTDADRNLAEAMSKMQSVGKNLPYPIPTLTGDYLAGRIASDNGDMKSASLFLSRALDNDKDNPELAGLALPVSVAARDFESAYSLAKQLHDKGKTLSYLGSVVAVSYHVKKNDIITAWEYTDKMNPEGLGAYLKPLLRAWLSAADKSPVTAETILRNEISKQPLLASLYLTHLGLISEFRKDDAKAADYYKEALNQQFSVRMASLVGSFYENTERMATVHDMYNRLGDEFHSKTFSDAVKKRMEEKRKPPRNVINVGDGIAMALFDLAGILHQEKASRLALLFAEVASYLKPADDFNNILLGDIYITAGMSDEAVKMYGSVKPESDVYTLTRLRLADTYESSGKSDEALNVLNSINISESIKYFILKKKADTLRRAERFKEAIPVYDEVIKNQEGRRDKRDWTLYYGRGLCYEQLKNWEMAEKDLKTALEIEPEQPLVLNYLGYTWADKGMNINLALSYIKKASELEPDDGYIADSMGWVLFRLGKYEQAVMYLEHAVGLVPNDATINDHLGDVYWHVNRKIEAKFQWQRAFEDEKDISRKQLIKEKIEKGYIPTQDDSEIKEKAGKK